jgi:hypothetical protein
MVGREFVTSNDKLRIEAYRYIIEASIDVSERHAQAIAYGGEIDTEMGLCKCPYVGRSSTHLQGP